MNNKNIFIIISIILLVLFSPVTASDWSMLNGNIEHTGFIEESSNHVPDIWHHEISEAIKTSPAISGDKLIITTEKGSIICLNLNTKKEIWKKDINTAIFSSPVIYDDFIYVASNNGDVRALNIDDGTIKWTRNINSSVKSTPAIVDDKLFIGSDKGYFYTLDIDDGDRVWRYKMDKKITASPTVLNGTVFIGCEDGTFYAINAANGKIKWNYTTGGNIKSSAAYYNNTLYFGSDDGNLYALNKDGNLIWSQDLSNKIISSPMIDSYNNNVYVGTDNNEMNCIDTRDGTVKWTVKVGDKIKSTPSLLNDTVVFTDIAGNLHFLNKYTGEENWTYIPGRVILNEKTSSSAAIYGNNVIFSTEEGNTYIANYNKKTGEFPYDNIILIGTGIIIILLGIAIYVFKRRKN